MNNLVRWSEHVAFLWIQVLNIIVLSKNLVHREKCVGVLHINLITTVPWNHYLGLCSENYPLAFYYYSTKKIRIAKVELKNADPF